MNEFQDWLMCLESQTLTEDLKIEILSKMNKIINAEIINILININQK